MFNFVWLYLLVYFNEWCVMCTGLYRRNTCRCRWKFTVWRTTACSQYSSNISTGQPLKKKKERENKNKTYSPGSSHRWQPRERTQWRDAIPRNRALFKGTFELLNTFNLINHLLFDPVLDISWHDVSWFGISGYDTRWLLPYYRKLMLVLIKVFEIRAT